MWGSLSSCPRREYRKRKQRANNVLARVDYLRDPQVHAEAGQDAGILPREVLLLGEVA